MTIPIIPKYYTIKETAIILRASPAKLYEMINSAINIFEFKRLKREEDCEEFKKEYCPVCGKVMLAGERFCSDRCELIFFDERGEG